MDAFLLLGNMNTGYIFSELYTSEIIFGYVEENVGPDLPFQWKEHAPNLTSAAAPADHMQNAIKSGYSEDYFRGALFESADLASSRPGILNVLILHENPPILRPFCAV